MKFLSESKIKKLAILRRKWWRVKYVLNIFTNNRLAKKNLAVRMDVMNVFMNYYFLCGKKDYRKKSEGIVVLHSVKLVRKFCFLPIGLVFEKVTIRFDQSIIIFYQSETSLRPQEEYIFDIRLISGCIMRIV